MRGETGTSGEDAGSGPVSDRSNPPVGTLVQFEYMSCLSIQVFFCIFHHTVAMTYLLTPIYTFLISSNLIGVKCKVYSKTLFLLTDAIPT